MYGIALPIPAKLNGQPSKSLVKPALCGPAKICGRALRISCEKITTILANIFLAIRDGLHRDQITGSATFYNASVNYKVYQNFMPINFGP